MVLALGFSVTAEAYQAKPTASLVKEAEIRSDWLNPKDEHLLNDSTTFVGRWNQWLFNTHSESKVHGQMQRLDQDIHRHSPYRGEEPAHLKRVHRAHGQTLETIQQEAVREQVRRIKDLIESAPPTSALGKVHQAQKDVKKATDVHWKSNKKKGKKPTFELKHSFDSRSMTDHLKIKTPLLQGRVKWQLVESLADDPIKDSLIFELAREIDLLSSKGVYRMGIDSGVSEFFWETRLSDRMRGRAGASQSNTTVAQNQFLELRYSFSF
jgi:hypothetical protein